MKVAALLATVALTACATVPEPGPEPSIYHYLRTNIDGSEPEHIVQFFPNPRRIEVYKWVEKCKTAAYVTADFDPVVGEATALYAGKVARDGSQERFGRIMLDRRSNRLEVRLDLPDAKFRERVDDVGKPWALFDYDLADLNAALQARPPVSMRREYPPRKQFASWWGLAGSPDEKGRLVRSLGWVDAYGGMPDRKDGARVWRYWLKLRNDPDVVGRLWVFPLGGIIQSATFAKPNHDNYRDFKLELQRIEPGGQQAWDRLLKAHYGDCPAVN